MDLSKAIEDAERIERENVDRAYNRPDIVTIIKTEREDEEEFFTTIQTINHLVDRTEWRSDESFEEIVIEAFDRFDTSDGLFPVLRRSNRNPNAWIVTKSLNAAALDI